jgi:hypothetical protein
MAEPSPIITYRTIGAENLDTSQPLWEKLRAYHATLPWHFADEMPRTSFAPRNC